ncbi:MFS transporter [Oceanobacillus halophilus]|uniref:MFS transporter n=1 Tax=Oceanobacillus halophilus TaxID=930130 RepID=A0A495A213_9BACI|nr:MFS transporter [Oceanobacillus halophilus]RKQ33426.1 MFS transporter [Oceanobacillus halophilus]
MERHQVSSQKWAIGLFTVGVFMAGLDNGIISTALTTIGESFGVSPSWGAWTVTLYTLGLAISTPIIGKLSDRYGRKRLFIIEIALFGFGSVLVALSPNFLILLMARVIQAIGGGGIFIIGSSHILATLPKEVQGKALGMLGGMHGLSAVIGPNLGAVILSLTGSWQWMFLINVPIAIILILFAFWKLDESRPGTEKPLDMMGTALLTISILSFMYGITQMGNTSFHVVNLLFIVVGLIGFIFLVFHERNLENKGADPILSYSLLTERKYIGTLILGFLSGGFLAGIIFIPAFVQQVLNVPVEHAGYWVTPLALASGVGAGIGGVVTDKYGPLRAIYASGIIGIIGFSLFVFIVNGFVSFSIASALAGISLGILLGAPLNMLAGESAKETEKGTAIGTLSLIRQIGLTIFPAVFAGFIAISKTDGYRQMFLTAAALALLVILVGMLLAKQSHTKQ